MTASSKIIERCGGTRALAAAMGLAPSTVQSWKESLIPAHRQKAVMAAGQAMGVRVTPADFFDDSLAGPAALATGAV